MTDEYKKTGPTMNKFHEMLRKTRPWYILLCCALAWHLGVVNTVKAWENDTSPLGINLSWVCYWSTEFPFKDLFKQSQPWQSQMKGKAYGQGSPLVLSPLGWVRWLRPGQSADTLITRAMEGSKGTFHPRFLKNWALSRLFASWTGWVPTTPR